MLVWQIESVEVAITERQSFEFSRLRSWYGGNGEGLRGVAALQVMKTSPWICWLAHIAIGRRSARGRWKLMIHEMDDWEHITANGGIIQGL